MATYMRVLAVPGRMLPMPGAHAQLRVVGHQMRHSETEARYDMFADKHVPLAIFEHSSEVALVPDPFAGFYYYNAIKNDGDLDYVEHVSDPDTPQERTWKDPALVEATKRHRAARGASDDSDA